MIGTVLGVVFVILLVGVGILSFIAKREARKLRGAANRDGDR